MFLNGFPTRYSSFILQCKDTHFQFIRFTGNSELSVKVMWNDVLLKERVFKKRFSRKSQSRMTTLKA